MPLLSIIVPVFNEENILEKSLPLVMNLNINKEVIIINDGSSDESLAVLKKMQPRFNFILLNLERNQGKGNAIRTGLKQIQGKYFTICDADLEYNPNELKNMVDYAEKLQSAQTAVYGSRYLDNKNFSLHYLINAFLTALTNILFKANLTDMETCFKLIPASALSVIKLTADRFDIEPQITAQLLKNNYAIHDLAISYHRRNYKEGKKIKPRDGLMAILMLLKERFI